jgi:glutamate synthase domain-containing protein 3
MTRKELSDLIARHYEFTGSKVAEKILTRMDDYMDRFHQSDPL